MKASSKQTILSKFLNSERHYPVIAAIAAGLYPLFFYYTNNFTLINSWSHLAFFIGVFLVAPILLFMVATYFFKLGPLVKFQKYVLPFLTIFVFLFFLKVCLYAGVEKKLTVVIGVVALLFSIFLYRHLKKVIVVLYLLAFIGLFSLSITIYNTLNYSTEWMKQPDDITNVVFKKKPNVYYLQPDGYANFSELNSGYYQIKENLLEAFLTENNFTNYPGFRSNYEATLSSNSSIFMMKHHYYGGSVGANEVTNAREVIISKNAVLDIFKKNDYKTYFVSEMPYLLMNRPTMGYDASNFSYDEVPFISTGLDTEKDIFPFLKSTISESTEQPKFFFIEIFHPKHISGSKAGENLAENKRRQYIEDLAIANETIMRTVKLIKENDPGALIMIMADHGGYVGMEYLQQGNVKTEDRDKIYSIFSSQLSIHWPEENAPDYDSKLKTSVNVFRILFSYLSGNTAYLQKLEDDISYGLINEGAPKGVYQFIDDKGKIDFKEVLLFE